MESLAVSRRIGITVPGYRTHQHTRGDRKSAGAGRGGMCDPVRASAPEWPDAFDDGVAELLPRKNADNIFGARTTGAVTDAGDNDRHRRFASSHLGHDVKHDIVVAGQDEVPMGDVAEPYADVGVLDAASERHVHAHAAANSTVFRHDNVFHFSRVSGVSQEVPEIDLRRRQNHVAVYHLIGVANREHIGVQSRDSRPKPPPCR